MLAAHLGAVEIVVKKCRARPLDPDADRVRSPENYRMPSGDVTDLDGDAAGTVSKQRRGNWSAKRWTMTELPTPRP